MRTPETCPNCGADVPRNAKACPECGSDESTGWSDDAHTQSLDLPDQEFNYDEFAQREFGKPKRSPRQIFWWVVAIGLLLLMLLWFLP
ncbi:MAG TPA: zinc-ribbon domain-containing protein [Methylomirabilota bacterium]|nr:zinc-ribbon domain-containing protein [Methylomirabilota bacterium]